eukprot:TRINITY_DN4547_c0_g1_i2.p1 TRINITY_DN4547_c0_g1~~TRINITY_DN4547_c0_g1_i2.p1  ORF type:complete len:202 (-),score=33.69 TRINITY_DN4547_c0_g1_i2:14-619(-)
MPPTAPFLQQPQKQPNRPTLVLDVDLALVHVVTNYGCRCGPSDHPASAEDVTPASWWNGPNKHRFCYYRPGLHAFLKDMCEVYEVVVFSAGWKRYLDKVLVGYEHYFSAVLHMEHTDMDNVVKDLSKLGRDLSRVIFIDDRDDYWKLQPRNAICIPEYDMLNWNTDKELNRLRPLLLAAAEVPDVRDYLDTVVDAESRFVL